MAVGPQGSSQNQSTINNPVIDRLPCLVNMTVQQSGGFHDFAVGFLERGILTVSVYSVLQMQGGGYADVLVLQVPDNKADAVPCERLC